MLGRRVLLLNPPPVNGIAFTRQGRCQEREEVLGTTKPPYTLALVASLLRDRGIAVRVVDQIAEAMTTEALIDKLRAEDFAPSLVCFCSSTPTLDADAIEAAKLKAAFGMPLVCFGPHASSAPRESMERAPVVDAMVVGEPEDAILALVGMESLAQAGHVPGLTYRRDGAIVPAAGRGSYADFLSMPYPAWDLLPLERYRVPLENKPYLIVETSRGCPYSCDFCVAPIYQGHKFREREAVRLVDEIERGKREFGTEYFYLWADTVTLNAKSFSVFCDELIRRDLKIKWFGNARADNMVDPGFVTRVAQSGCWMLSLGIESESDAIRKDMMKRLERQKIQLAIRNMRDAGIKSFAFFIFGYPGDTVESIERTARYSRELNPDFANFYPAVPYPGTELHGKCLRDGTLASDDWTKMEYSYYLLRGNGLDEDIVMGAVRRATRDFFLRPSWIVRHAPELARLVLNNGSMVWQAASRVLRGK
jgi:anaerobic magnesium-protoporphyrin IX monomethyl ester cyclase